uniref:Peptidase_S9 domain-containing protein n=1 Tax=Rhabditophanes sp. KR3021 TaxID=114890 RepID=A0AC35U2E7_9BILA
MPIIHNEDIVLSSGYIANVQMLIPRGYDLDSKTDRLPAVLDVYGGSGLQKVTDSLVALIGLSMSLASKNEYIMIFVDGRGGMYRGWDIKEPTYQKLGTYEVDDTIETMKILTEKYSLIDRTRRGIWGWSYGGFLTAKAIQKDNDHIFKCAASVAPVTNFLYYDATYTERYMGPADGKGYIETDLTTANLSNFEKTREDQSNLVHYPPSPEQQHIYSISVQYSTMEVAKSAISVAETLKTSEVKKMKSLPNVGCIKSNYKNNKSINVKETINLMNQLKDFVKNRENMSRYTTFVEDSEKVDIKEEQPISE